jgi:1-acyl-sn-glycerol-3-phosphate acyltransferase
MRRSERPGFWIRLAACVVRPLSTTLARRRWSGRSNLPSHGSVILAVNHVCVLDPLMLAHFVYGAGRVPRFMATSGLFKVVGLRRVLRGAGQIPVYRDSPDAADALRGAVESLRAGRVVVIYPEGGVTRDPDYWPMRARTGLARLALTTGAPVVPVAVWGPQQVWGRDRRFRPLPRKTVAVAAGPPVDLTAFVGVEPTAAALREVTDVVMTSVRQLVGEVRGEPVPEGVWNPAVGVRVPSQTAPQPAVPQQPGGSQRDEPQQPGGSQRDEPQRNEPRRNEPQPAASGEDVVGDGLADGVADVVDGSQA